MELHKVKLRELYSAIPCTLKGDGDTFVTGLAYDSRTVKPGDLFFCISGFRTDGNIYANAAAEKGAAAIASEQYHPQIDLPQVIVRHDRRSMAEASAAFFGFPARRMRMIGVTGTNGKTTTTYMYKRIAEEAGRKVGLIGTIRNMIGDKELHAERTTPESPDLQKLLFEMNQAGCDTVVMEVSSHSLALDRTYGIEFDVGIFTNLTQDHLDFHGTFDAYLEAKELLFGQSKVSLVNLDDPHAALIAEHAAGECRMYSARTVAEYEAKDIHLEPHCTSYTFAAYRNGVSQIEVPIPGMFSVYNSMAATAAALESGISEKVAAKALKSMPAVDGRFQMLDTRGRDFVLILDYAHTPDSLENTLETVREFSQGRVVTVFGCGGNRDRTKRPVMGEIAARLSDVVYVTSDNPRFEDPDAIIDDIEKGIPENSGCVRITDRREAIRTAIEKAEPHDVIVLAGKGHETYQEICGVKHDFDEKVVVNQIFEELGW